LLLPFIGNLDNSSHETPVPMFLDDDYSYHDQNAFGSSNHNDINTFSSQFFNESLNLQSFDYFDSNNFQYSKTQLDQSNRPEDATFHNKIWNSNLPFFTNVSQSKPLSCSIEEGDSRAQLYIKECWEEFETKCRSRNLDMDLQRVNETWKEITRCLRNLDWHRVQCLLKEMEQMPMNEYFGEQIQPSIVFWSSGGRIHHANDQFCKLVGYSPEELRTEGSIDMNVNSQSPFGRDKIRAHSVFHPEEMMKILKRQLEASQHPEKSSYQLNTRLLSKNRQEIPISCSILNLRDTLGLPLLTVAIFV